MRLRVTGEGEPGAFGGPAGDLYVVLNVQESKTFVRDGFDIILSHEVSMVQAALGCDVDIPTLKGQRSISIPTGSQHGDRIALAGEGVPHIRGVGQGDFIVQLDIKIPKRLNKQQRELLEKFAEISGENIQRKSGGGFFQKMFE